MTAKHHLFYDRTSLFIPKKINELIGKEDLQVLTFKWRFDWILVLIVLKQVTMI